MSDSATLFLLTQRETFAQLNPAVQAFVQDAVAQLTSATERNRLLVCCTFVITMFDTLQAIPAERKVFWGAKASVTKFLYLYVRIIFAVVQIVYFGLFFGAWSPSSCERGRWLLPALPFLVIPASQLLLGIRAYSVWGRSRWLIALLAIPWMFTLAAHVYTINDTSGYAPFLRSTGPCLVTGTNEKGLSIVFAAFGYISFDLVVTCCVMWKVTSLWRSQKNLGMGGLPQVIMRESLVYFLTMFCLYVTDVVYILAHYGKAATMGDVSFVAAGAGVLLTLRITMNLRMEETFAQQLDKDRSTIIVPRGRSLQYGSRQERGIIELHNMHAGSALDA